MRAERRCGIGIGSPETGVFLVWRTWSALRAGRRRILRWQFLQERDVRINNSPKNWRYRKKLRRTFARCRLSSSIRHEKARFDGTVRSITRCAPPPCHHRRGGFYRDSHQPLGQNIPKALTSRRSRGGKAHRLVGDLLNKSGAILLLLPCSPVLPVEAACIFLPGVGFGCGGCPAELGCLYLPHRASTTARVG